jgi:cation diffusion facilitator CzcD-associated flavoprotein CzcO
MGSIGEPDVTEVECLVIGGGFGAVALLRQLLKNGFDARVYEKGSTFGGIWYWNCYPGARVDTDTPVYQFFEKELYDDFTYKERYPSWPDLRSYFEHVDRKEGLRQHFVFNKNVDTAHFHEDQRKWLVECTDGSQTWCRWFLPCLGFASKKYIPRLPGLGDFKGEVHHTGAWPQYGINLKGKRIAQIGTGATGIQCAQEIGDDAKHLTIYQRTPNMTLPMNQYKLDPAEERKKKDNGEYDAEFEKCRTTFSGLPYDFLERKTFDDGPEERQKTYYDLMVTQGGFRFWLGNYKDFLFVQESNDEAYKFWRDETRKRIKDPKKQRILAPDEPPHPIGTKRMSLEQRFYEVVNQDHVDIIDVSKSPIIRVEEDGIRTQDEGVVPVDIIILATGFDGVSGSLGQLNICDGEGKPISGQ